MFGPPALAAVSGRVGRHSSLITRLGLPVQFGPVAPSENWPRRSRDQATKFVGPFPRNRGKACPHWRIRRAARQAICRSLPLSTVSLRSLQTKRPKLPDSLFWPGSDPHVSGNSPQMH